MGPRLASEADGDPSAKTVRGVAVSVSAARHASTASSADAEPIYFGRGEAPLFGCFHAAREPLQAGAALVICQPFGQEYVRCHRLLRVLAATLARSGLPVLRFDYFGCGDSRGESEDATLERCVADVGEAVRFVRGRTRALSVDLLGLRLGASIAMRFAADCRGQIGRMVLWDPVVRGVDFLRSMREQNVSFAKRMKRAYRRPARPGETDGPRDFVGFRFSEAVVDELNALDLLDIAESPRGRVLIFDNGEDPAVTALNEHLDTMGARVELERLSSPRIWLAEPYQGIVPRDSLERLSHWLLEPTA